MISTRRLVVVAVLCPAIVVAGCSTSGAGHPSGNNATSTTSASPALPPATDAAGLTELLRRGISSVNSAHLVLNVTTPSQTVTGEGDAKLAGGALKALDITEQLGSGDKRRLLIVDQGSYAQLGGTPNPAGKPWLLITQDSANPTARNLATSLEAVRRSASFEHFSAFASAARSVTLVGKESLNGTPVDHYSIVVDVAKLPNDTPGRQPLLAAGIATLPLELYVDGQGRPVKATQDLTVQGQHSTTAITFSKFNEPVSITAPPADQVERS
ncbi:MAG: hypothetical protein JO287_20945 [Pseudonocardiales bacterium]|nr:hypothetical protein [Pseudonocardiales bacterium]